MTNLQEAKLAREAEICYSTLAMVTDYDCWHPDHDAVTAEQIMGVLGRNAETAARPSCAPPCAGCPSRAAASARPPSSTRSSPRPSSCPEAVKRELEPIVGRYMK